jgi:formamidopyrimidine-DNA glycosylase
MPELPEVETVRRGLERLLPGREVASETHDWAKGFPNASADVEQFLLGASVLEVRRRAKVLLIDLSSDYSLVIHLKMTGQLVFVGMATATQSTSFPRTRESSQKSTTVVDSSSDWIPAQGRNDEKGEPSGNSEIRFGAGHPNDSLVGKLPDKTTRVTLAFRDGSRLFFNDQRKFGWMRLIPTFEIEDLDFFKNIGPEPLAADFNAQDFVARMRRRPNSSVKAVILDQAIVAGVGNIYADESLWGAKIHPAALVRNLSNYKLKLLHKELVYVLNLSIEKGGSSDRNYVNAEGKKGSYITFARVFRKEGQPCPRCGRDIIKTKVANRGTHLCPKCQT